MTLTDKQLEKAAKAMVDVGYTKGWNYGSFLSDPVNQYYVYDKEGTTTVYAPVDPFNNEAQRQALLEYLKVCVFAAETLEGIRWYARDIFSNICTEQLMTRKEAENACLIACLEES